MDMYPSGSVKLLQVENEDLDIYIFGEDLDKIMENKKLNLNISSTISLWSRSKDTVLKTIISDGNLMVNKGIKMMPVFFENGNYELVIQFKKENSEINFVQNGVNINEYFKTINDVFFGTLRLRSDVGYTNIDIYSNSKKIVSIMIEVFPSKMDYQKDYIEMISEINEEIASIAFKLLDKTYLEGKLVDTRYQTKTEFINILDHIFENFVESLKFIVNNFKHNIIEYEKIVSINKVKKMSKNTAKHVRTKPYLLEESENGIFAIRGKRYTPRTAIERKKETTIDIFENQMIKYIIKHIIKRIERLEYILTNNNGLEYKEKIDGRYKLRDKKRILNGFLEKYFKNISDILPKQSMSLVFQMSPGYKEVYKKYTILSKGLDLGHELFKITPKKIYELYEMWCYIKLHKILYDLGYEVKNYGIVGHKGNGLYLKLNTDEEASMIYEKDNQALRLWYNKNYSVPTTNQRPDTVLYIENLNSSQNRTYIFDAKYRMKIEDDGREGPVEADINIMHRYRDAIVSELSDGFKYKYETFGAYVMFPCSDEIEFKNHKFYKSIDKINIGAFPMLPGSTGLITEHLKKILGQSDLEAKEDRLIIDEFDDYAKFKREDIMVVNSKDENHLNAYLENRFFHIPKKYLTNVRLGVEYIAFYQPISTFKEKSGIYHYGKIKEVIEYKRKDCKEIPKTKRKEEIYLRFNLEEIREINKINPIQIAPRLISYTTLYLLNNAENMHELKIKNSLEMRVYKILNHYCIKKDYKLLKIDDCYEMGKNRVEIIDGKHIKINGEFTDTKSLESLLS